MRGMDANQKISGFRRIWEIKVIFLVSDIHNNLMEEFHLLISSCQYLFTSWKYALILYYSVLPPHPQQKSYTQTKF